MSLKTAYAKSGVDLGRAHQILKLIDKQNPISYFASTVKAPSSFGRLAFSVDGAGTKIDLLDKFGLHRVSGWDAVAMNANDLLCAGAKPLWFLDYFVQGKLDKKVFAQVLKGINKALKVLRADLIGGETAEHPGLFTCEASYDIGGFLVGTTPEKITVGPKQARAGDVLLGLASSGPHANGFSLIRKTLGSRDVARHKNALLAPTRLYHPMIFPLLSNKKFKGAIHSIAHITGGAFVEKIPRALPKGLGANLVKDSWPVPAVFKMLCRRAGLSFEEAIGVWNMGIGLVLICDADRYSELQRYFKGQGIGCWKIGHVTSARSSSRLTIV